LIRKVRVRSLVVTAKSEIAMNAAFKLMIELLLSSIAIDAFFEESCNEEIWGKFGGCALGLYSPSDMPGTTRTRIQMPGFKRV
jgi:hypothetical protein